MWFRKQEKVVHEVIAVTHKPRPNGRCIVWVICSCGESHAYTKLSADDDGGVHTMRQV